jgi:hypothetical protein
VCRTMCTSCTLQGLQCVEQCVLHVHHRVYSVVARPVPKLASLKIENVKEEWNLYIWGQHDDVF